MSKNEKGEPPATDPEIPTIEIKAPSPEIISFAETLQRVHSNLFEEDLPWEETGSEDLSSLFPEHPQETDIVDETEPELSAVLEQTEIADAFTDFDTELDIHPMDSEERTEDQHHESEQNWRDEQWNTLKTETIALEDHPSVQPVEEWGRLHPYSLLINLLPQMGRTIQNAWPLLLFILVGGNQSRQVFDSIFVLFFIGLSFIRTIIHFMTLRYRVEDGKLRLKMGLIFKQSRTLDPARIQNMEITQNLLHKYFDLVELRLETAGDASTKGLLSALSLEDATRLKIALQRSRSLSQKNALSSQSQPDMTLNVGEIILFGLSKRTMGAVVLLSLFLSEAMSMMQPEEVQYFAHSMNLSLFVGLLSISFGLSWLGSSIQALLQYFRLEVFIHEEDIAIASGLITRRNVEIPKHKIQTVEWFEPWLRRQMGYGTLYLETAAFGMADGEIRRSEGIVPMVSQEQVAGLLNEILPTTSTELLQSPTHRPHRNARFVLLLGYLVPASLAMLLTWWFFDVSPLILSLLAILSVVIVGGLTELDFNMQHWAITPNGILSREGYLNRRTTIIDREKVQTVYRTEGPLLQLLGLSQVIVCVAGSIVRLPLVDTSDAAQILEQLTTADQS